MTNSYILSLKKSFSHALDNLLKNLLNFYKLLKIQKTFKLWIGVSMTFNLMFGGKL